MTKGGKQEVAAVGHNSYAGTRFNAVKHAVLSRYTVLPWEDAGEYDGLFSALIEEHLPEGPTEEHLVEELAGILWRKRRLRLAEAAAHRRGLESGASGVVRSASRVVPPVSYPTDPIRPHGHPAASKMAASRYVVVVLPFVPVTPTTVRSWLGSWWKAAASSASARRASSTITHATRPSTGGADADTTSTAPRPMASAANAAPSKRCPLTATKIAPPVARRES